MFYVLWKISSIFSSRSFIVQSFIFTFLISLGVNFFYMIWGMIWSTLFFFFYIWMASKSYWKDYLCSTKLPLHPFWKINWPYACRFMSGLCPAALICVSVFTPVPHSLDCCRLMSWSQIVYIFQFGSFSSLFWPLGPLQFCLRFRFNWSVFTKQKAPAGFWWLLY